MPDIHVQTGIKLERLKNRMKTMAQIGATDKGGVSRLALTEEDRKARKLFIQWMQELGLTTRVDDLGNIYGRLEGIDPKASPVLTGSHLDSVPKGGKFDGTLGVLAALEAVETIKEKGIKPLRSIEIVSFTNEEGARFTPQMLGSGVIAGKFTKDYVYGRKDAEGLLFKEELERIGFMGCPENRITCANSFVELHIEQGPILEAEEKSIGVVEGIAGFYWLKLKVSGQSDHSGSTPMNMRKDSLVAASSIITDIYQWASERKDGLVATVGQIQAFPGIINAIPGETVFTLDIRHADPEKLEEAVSEATSIIQQSSADVTITEIGSNPPVRFSKEVTSLIEESCKDANVSYRKIISGAGHDAMYMNNITETAMIFVPSTNGKSHCEEEHTAYPDIEKGANVLYLTLWKLANR
ncbi:Zn-dependent hydrolase [Siminovitchia sediminis]|uniref:Zn-dependent hydrolase n=1 Tax=Siminovitchia sediminis TaxID=1274353 RepID=A0ABW4KHZ1_9BACI